MRAALLSDSIKETEYQLAKFNFVQQHFPNARITNYHRFISESVNINYTSISFYRGYMSVHVVPYCELDFDYNGNNETIKIHSTPYSSRLAYIGWDRIDKKQKIKFSRLKINLKTHNFKDDMINSCRVEIMTFIKENTKFDLDTKHLEPRLKKLILVT